MAQWRKANPKLAEALDKRNAERGTSKTSNPLMKDFKPKMAEREKAASTNSPSNIGPVKDGNTYANSLKINPEPKQTPQEAVSKARTATSLAKRNAMAEDKKRKKN
jgi:hypothetical protein